MNQKLDDADRLKTIETIFNAMAGQKSDLYALMGRLIKKESDVPENEPAEPVTPAPKPLRWMPERRQVYFFRDSCSIKCSDFWDDSAEDHHRRNHMGIFPTAEARDRWYRIDAVIRKHCGEAVEGKHLFAVYAGMGYKFMTDKTEKYDPSFRYWTNDPEAADKINADLTEDDRRWFLTGGR